MKPLLSIWISPVETFEFLSTREDSENQQSINILSVLITIGVGVPRLKEFLGSFEDYRVAGLIIGIVLLGLIGIIAIRFLLALTYWAIGKMLRGKASKKQISYFNKFSYGYAFINILIPVGVGELVGLT